MFFCQKGPQDRRSHPGGYLGQPDNKNALVVKCGIALALLHDAA
jgi:hypothetical protein